MKAICLALVMLATGCISCKAPEQMISGTSITIGVFIPYAGQLFGIQCFHYLSGTTITSTNSCEVTYTHEGEGTAFGTTSKIKKQIKIK